MSNEMIGKCSCCGEKTLNDLCTYCGLVNVVDIDGSDNSIIKERAISHKNRIVNSIKNISVKTYKYGWNSANTDVEEKSTSKFRLCDGIECFGKVYKCPEKFEQNPADTDEERTLYISYEINGNEKTVPVALKPVKCPEHWELWIKIDENLKLTVYVGVDGNCAVKSGVMLELV